MQTTPNKTLFFFTLFLLFALSSQAQTIVRGKIFAQEEKAAIPYASLYVREVQSGTVADGNGQFILRLQPGTYHLEIRSMGYQTLHTTLEVGTQELTPTYTLSTVVYQLNEVTVVAKKRNEDPAYPIMRELMARTPVYARMVRKSQFETYSKGTGSMQKLPKMLQETSTDGGIKLKEYIGKTFVSESHIRVLFESPNRYKKHVLALRSSIPQELKADSTDFMDIVTSNVYGRKIGLNAEGTVDSPIREDAFSMYNYRLLGTTTEGDKKIHHIGFTDKSGEMVKGDLHVIADTWSLQRLQLEVNIRGVVRQGIKIELNEVAPEFYLPTTYAINTHFDIMGMKGYLNYYTSLRYVEVQGDQGVLALNKMPDGQRFRTRKEVKKRTQQLAQQLDTLGYNVPDKYFDPRSNIHVNAQMDSLVLKRDSSYWDNIVPTPLNEEELRSYAQRDSITQELEKKKNIFARTKKAAKNSKWGSVIEVLMGTNYAINKKTSIGFEGLLFGLVNDLTYAEGLWMGQRIDFSHAFTPGIRWTISPSAYYTTRRKQVYWDVTTQLLYAPKLRGELMIQGGQQGRDISDETKLQEFAIRAGVVSLAPGVRSCLQYERSYLKVANKIDLLPGVQLGLNAQLRRSAPIETNRDWMLWKVNTPFRVPTSADSLHAERSTQFATHNTFEVGGSLIWDPSPYYRLDNNGRKYHLSPAIKTPIFALTYRQAIPLDKRFDSDYLFLGLSMYQSLYLNYSWIVDYRIEAGHFFRDHRVYPEERVYLKGENSSIFISKRSPFAFYTPRAYTPLNGTFVRANTIWKTPPMLTALSSKLRYIFKESLHFSAAWERVNPNAPYFEAGYSISFGNMFHIGGYYGGYNFYHQRAFALRISVPIFNDIRVNKGSQREYSLSISF